MTAAEVETLLQRTRERFPDARPRLISDNGPQFIAKDFKAFIRRAGMTHVRTAPYYPQSNGKMERWYQTLKVTTIRPIPPTSLADARCMVARTVSVITGDNEPAAFTQAGQSRPEARRERVMSLPPAMSIE
jgi:transposase InsO family protein